MKALLLAAGYATRLRPLTDEIAKPLLPVGGRPMIDWILDSVRASGEVDEVHVVTNSVYAAAFARWGDEHGVRVHDDGTSSNDDRLGALGDIRFAMREGGLRRRRPARDRGRQPLRVLAGRLHRLLAREGQAARSPCTSSPTRASRRSTASSSSTATTGSSAWRRSRSTRAATSSRPRRTSSRRSTSALLDRYLDEGNPPDPPGRFVTWLAEREPVFGYRFSEAWLDIGDPAQLLEADNLYRAGGRACLRARSTRRTPEQFRLWKNRHEVGTDT